MKQEKKSKISNSKKTTIILVIVLLLLAVAASFAYFFAILKGENVNTAKTSSASIVYTEPEIGTETKEMTKYEGMTSATPYEFTVTGKSTGTTSLDYAVYVEELAGNTVDKSKINYYLTDENDIPIMLETRSSYNGQETIITPTGDNLYYTTKSDITIKDGSNTTLLNKTLTDEDEETAPYLLSYYAKNVLKLTQNGTFNMEIYGACYQISYDNQTEKATIENETELDSSACTLSYVESEDADTFTITKKSDNEVLYTAIKRYMYMNFADGTTFDGNSTQYIANKLNKTNQGDSFYARNGYSVINNEKPELLSSYCVKYTKNEAGFFDEELADDSNCSNAYTVILGEPEVTTIGARDDVYSEIFEGISNVLTSDVFNFEDGKSVGSGQYGDPYIQNRNEQLTKTYRLRYWISNDVSSNSSTTTKQEATTTTEGKTHTVEFGSDGIFKFKVNVYAKQGNTATEGE